MCHVDTEVRHNYPVTNPTNMEFWWRISSRIQCMHRAMIALVLLLLPLMGLVATANAGDKPKSKDSTARSVEGVTNTTDAGLVAYYMMNEGSGTTLWDSSGTGNNATITGSPTWPAGMKGLAIKFSGSSQFASAVSSTSLNITGSITLAGWFKCEKTGFATQRIVQKGVQTVDDGYELSLSSAGAVFFRLNDKSGGDSKYRINSTTTYPLNGSAWMHAAATFDASTNTMKLYINGVQEGGSLTGPGTIGSNTDPLSIARQSDNNDYYQGQIDELRVYNVALSQTDIQALMNHTITATAGAGGLISPSGMITVAHKGSQSFTITPNGGYVVSDVKINAMSRGALTSYTFSNVMGDSTISATFAPSGSHTITASAGANGSINPSGPVSVSDGGSQTFTITPNTGYHIDSVIINNVYRGTMSSYTFNNVQADSTIRATFAINTYALTLSTSGSGTAVKVPDQTTYNYHSSVTITATPTGGAVFVGWSGSVSGATNPIMVYTDSNMTVVANFGPSLVGRWAMDEGSGTLLVDSSTYGNNASIKNSPTWTAGVHGQALLLNGTSQYAVVPSSTSLNLTGRCTFVAWVRPYNHGTYRILAKVTGSAGYEFFLGGATPYPVSVRLNGSAASRLDSKTTYPTNGVTWMHVAATADSNMIRMYINGVLDTSMSSTVLPLACSDSLGIGNNSSGTNYFAGALDEARIYNRALSLAEIQALASHTITASAGSGGSISPSGAVPVLHNADQTFTMTPDPGYSVSAVTIDGIPKGAITGYTFTHDSTDHTISVTFATIPSHTITATAGANGSISPSGAVSVLDGNSQTFTITPDNSYHIDSVYVNGVYRETMPSYTFTNVRGDSTISATFAHDLPLVGYWAMNEGSGTTLLDSSSYANNGTWFGSPSWVTGMKGQAISLNGTTQYGAVRDTSSLHITNAITLAAWIAPAKDSVQQRIISKAVQGTTDGYELTLSSLGQVFFRVNQTQNSGIGWKVQSTTLYPYSGSSWLHAAGTYDGTTFRIYINGAEEASWTAALAISSNADSLYIGRQKDGQYPFKGDIDEARIYNRALSLSEIQALASHTISASAGGGGSISPSGSVSVLHFANQTFTITPNTGYTISDVLVDGISQGVITSYTFTRDSVDHAISATFGSILPTHTITATAGPNGTISPSGGVSVADGGSQTFTITPATGYHIDSVIVNGLFRGTMSSYTFNNVLADSSISVKFAVTTYTLNVAIVGGGSVGKVPDQSTYNYGTVVQLTANPTGTWVFSGWSGDTTAAANRVSITLTANKNITATFTNPNNLVAYWGMDEGSGTTLVDSSTYGNTGTILGAPSWSSGIRGQALNFNGSSQYAAAPDVSSLDISGNITLAAWIAPAKLGTQRVICKAFMGSTDGYELSLSNGGKVFFRVNQKSHTDTYRVNSVSSYPVSGTTWIHAAATYAGDSLRIYINGTEEAAVGMTGTIGTNSDSLYIGRQKDPIPANTDWYQGQMDEARIYNRALSASEIRALMNHTIVASAGANGLIAPSGTVTVGHGGSQSFTITPNSGYHIDSLIVNGIYRGAMSTYAFTNVQSDSTIRAVFAANTVLLFPVDGSLGVSTSPALNVRAYSGSGDPMTVTFYGRMHSGSTGENFTLIELPDAQNYSTSSDGSAIFKAQTGWIVNQRSSRNIVYVNQIGDIVEDGDTYPIEWARVDSAMQMLEDPITNGLPEGIPYGVCVGNHDQTPKDDPNGTTTYFNLDFGSSHFGGKSYYGGHYGSDNDNNFQLFSASGMNFIVLSFEYNPAPPAALLHWADSLLKTYSSRRAIVCTHYLMDGGNPGPFSSQGRVIYDSLKDNPNLFLMLGGHTGPEGRRMDVYNGDTVYSVLADYQGEPNGGNGWLRIMQFSPTTSQINVQTYSPTLDQYKTGSSSQFTLNYTMSFNSYQVIGSNLNVASGSTASISWPGLLPLTQYDWYVMLDDGHSVVTGPTWSFTTKDTIYTIIASAGSNGTISPSGSVGVNRGANQEFVLTPAGGYHVDSIIVDNLPTDSTTSYTFYSVASAHTIRAVFRANYQTVTAPMSSGWNLISVPAQQPDMTPSGLFADDFGTSQYYVFQFNSQAGYSSPATMAMGQGYWLGSNVSKTVSATGNSLTTVATPVVNGFNIIGNPLMTSEPISNMSFSDGSTTKSMLDAAGAGWLSNVLYKYTGSGYAGESTALEVWRGYWIPMLRDGITVQYTTAGGSQAPKSISAVSEPASASHWQVDLSAILVTYDGKTYTDDVASFGVQSDAAAGFDARYDAPRPPRGPAEGYVEVALKVSGESYPAIFGSNYARLYHPPKQTQWELLVTAPTGGTVTLRWDNDAISALGNDVRINLYDVLNHRSVDMKTTRTYVYDQTESVRHFTVGQVERPVPTIFQLVQNYPNPFNPATIIRYGVPVDAVVSVEVFNVLGEKLFTLVNAEKKTAGYYEVKLDGSHLATGFYFYRMSAAGSNGVRFSDSKKMLLVK